MRWRLFFLILLVWGGCYFTASFWGVHKGVLLPATYVDQSIPFLKWTLWFYVLEYTMIPVAFILIRSEENFLDMVYALLTVIVISSAIFLLFPTLMPRPEICGESFLDAAFRLLHLLNPPTNCFPSMHVSLSVTVSVYMLRESKILGACSFIFAFLVIISTLTTKQHYFADILGGFAVSWVSIQIVKYSRKLVC